MPAYVGIKDHELADFYAKKSLYNSTINIHIKFNVHAIMSSVVRKLVKQWDYEYKYFGNPGTLKKKKKKKKKKNIKEIDSINYFKINIKYELDYIWEFWRDKTTLNLN